MPAGPIGGASAPAAVGGAPVPAAVGGAPTPAIGTPPAVPSAGDPLAPCMDPARAPAVGVRFPVAAAVVPAAGGGVTITPEPAAAAGLPVLAAGGVDPSVGVDNVFDRSAPPWLLAPQAEMVRSTSADHRRAWKVVIGPPTSSRSRRRYRPVGRSDAAVYEECGAQSCGHSYGIATKQAELAERQRSGTREVIAAL
jgi:hypothetical protein